MKLKVTAVYYVEAANWESAEQAVEQKLVDADRIESEPAGRAPSDMVKYAVASRIYDTHNKIFFEQELSETYDTKILKLREETLIWIESILEEVIKTNEQEWV